MGVGNHFWKTNKVESRSTRWYIYPFSIEHLWTQTVFLPWRHGGTLFVPWTNLSGPPSTSRDVSQGYRIIHEGGLLRGVPNVDLQTLKQTPTTVKEEGGPIGDGENVGLSRKPPHSTGPRYSRLKKVLGVLGYLRVVCVSRGSDNGSRSQ